MEVEEWKRKGLRKDGSGVAGIKGEVERYRWMDWKKDGGGGKEEDA